ncbi:hypothetical protein BV911_01780 [Pseudoruegeria sp. SK021]|nr:hypothetical protein BV911_01780 [Pseudoruegeria sp. SK021]
MTRTPHHDRNQALDKAMTLFWKQGYGATSMKHLEAALGMHPGSIYAAFQSKEMLFCLSLQRYFAQLGSARAAISDTAASPLDGLARFLREAHPVMCDDAPIPACMLARTSLEIGGTPGPITETLAEILRQNEASIAQSFAEAQAIGQLRADADPQALARRLQVRLMGLSAYGQIPSHRAATLAMGEDLAQEIEAMAEPGWHTPRS